MRHGILICDCIQDYWIIRIGKLVFPLEDGSPFDLWIQDHYYPVTLLRDTDWFVSFELEELSFSLREDEVYKIRINMEDYLPYVAPCQ